MNHSKITKQVLSSALKAETAAIFYNCKGALPLRVSLKEMGRPQPKIPVTTDNTTAVGLLYKSNDPQKSQVK